MVAIEPFQGVRPASGKPLDVKSLLRPGPDKRFREAGKTVQSWLGDGTLTRDDVSFYIYEQKLPDGRSRKGLVGALEAAGIEKLGSANPRQKTESVAASEDTGFQLEPVVCISEKLPESPDGELLLSFEDENGTSHRLLRIPADNNYDIGWAIAVDGLQHLGTGKAMAVVFSADDSWISPVHRMVDTGSISEKNAQKGISKALELTDTTLEDVRAGAGRFSLVFKSGKCFAVESESKYMDARLVQDAILDGVYKSDEGKGRVTYSYDLDQVLDEMAEKKHDLAIVMKAPSLDLLRETSSKAPKNVVAFPPEVLGGMIFCPVRRF
ncbi:MAG: DUF1015 family protein [Candidatus Methanomethylophilaceae archaeon]|nr:DUF1015 family protein [Candidatus Methanomethylophilaceae archaeon]